MVITARLTALLTFVVCLAWSANAFACKCDKSIKPISGSEMVFFGKVQSIKPRGAQDRAEFEVMQVYKGDEGREAVSVYTNRFQHDCGVRFEVDKTYMVYAYDFYPRGVATSMCWGTYAAEEPVSGDAWTKLEVEIPEETELEEQLRDIGKAIVAKCGQTNRVYDAGFSMILSPTGDPVLPASSRRMREKLERFRDCVGDAFLASDDLPRPEQPQQVEGWYQKEVRALPVAVDVLPCSDDCADWTTRVKSALMSTTPPEPKGKAEFNLREELQLCLESGISAVSGVSPGTGSVRDRRDRMLVECAVQRGELHVVGPYIGTVDNETLLAAIRWAQSKVAAPDRGKTTAAGADAGTADVGTPGLDSEGASKSAQVYPISTGELTFPSAAIRGEPTAGKFRILRSGFLQDEDWAQNQLYLEAFAQSILADEAAPPPMRDFAALALQRAGKLVPAKLAEYEKLAAEASGSEQARAMRDEFNAAWDKVHAPPAEVAAPEAEVEESEQLVEEEQPGGQDPLLLVIAGILIVVALVGIGSILKRRR